jgi:hypothetical protein
MLVRLERMLNAGVDSMFVTLPRALVMSMAMFDDSGPDRLYAYAYARLVPQLTCGLHHICGWRVSVSLTLVDMAFSTEGPERGVIETII